MRSPNSRREITRDRTPPRPPTCSSPLTNPRPLPHRCRRSLRSRLLCSEPSEERARRSRAPRPSASREPLGQRSRRRQPSQTRRGTALRPSRTRSASPSPPCPRVLPNRPARRLQQPQRNAHAPWIAIAACRPCSSRHGCVECCLLLRAGSGLACTVFPPCVRGSRAESGVCARSARASAALPRRVHTSHYTG